jgi:hypothetical protein
LALGTNSFVPSTTTSSPSTAAVVARESGDHPGGAMVQQSGQLDVDGELGEAALDIRAVQLQLTVDGGVTAPGDQAIEQPAQRTGDADGNPFEVERLGHVRPPAVPLAHQVLAPHPHVVEPHLVGAHPAPGGDPLHLDPRRVERHDQDGDPPMAGRVGVGAASQPFVRAVFGAGVPDLGAVDHPGIAVQHGRGPQRRQVAAGVGPGVTDGELRRRPAGWPAATGPVARACPSG